MAAESHALPVETNLIDPPAITKLFGSGAWLVLLFLLASGIHFSLAQINPIQGPEESVFARGAEKMFHDKTWKLPETTDGSQPPPLLFWSIKISYTFLGINDFSAHIPSAASIVLLTLLVAAIGKQLWTPWRGFLAGLIFLCTPGCLTAGEVSSAPLFCICFTAVFYAILRGLEKKPKRQFWYTIAWSFLGLACLAGGWAAIFLFTGTACLGALLSREIRIRLKEFPTLPGLITFCVLLAPWIWMQDYSTPRTIISSMPENPKYLLIGFFPWSIFLLVAVLRKAVSGRFFRTLDWHEIFLITACIAGIVFQLLLDPGFRPDLSLWIWAIGALWMVQIWHLLPERWMMVCLAITAMALILNLKLLFFFDQTMTLCSLALLLIPAWFEYQRRRPLTLLSLLVAFIPLFWLNTTHHFQALKKDAAEKATHSDV